MEVKIIGVATFDDGRSYELEEDYTDFLRNRPDAAKDLHYTVDIPDVEIAFDGYQHNLIIKGTTYAHITLDRWQWCFHTGDPFGPHMELPFRGVKEMAAAYHVPVSRLATHFGIPKRTAEDWAAGKSKPPAWVMPMLEELLEKHRTEGKI